MEVEGLTQRVLELFAGSFHSMAVLEDHSLVAWGCNKKGQLGVQTALACNPQPIPGDHFFIPWPQQETPNSVYRAYIGNIPAKSHPLSPNRDKQMCFWHYIVPCSIAGFDAWNVFVWTFKDFKNLGCVVWKECYTCVYSMMLAFCWLYWPYGSFLVHMDPY